MIRSELLQALEQQPHPFNHQLRVSRALDVHLAFQHAFTHCAHDPHGGGPAPGRAQGVQRGAAFGPLAWEKRGPGRGPPPGGNTMRINRRAALVAGREMGALFDGHRRQYRHLQDAEIGRAHV